MNHEEFIEKYKDDPVLSKMVELKKGDLFRVLNASYIAKRFFGKSRFWISQKLNNNIKNGKPVEFTKEEVETLRNAIYTISIELQEIADDLQ